MTSVEREQTNKHTNTYIHTHIHKHTYRVKTEETFFYVQIFIVYFSFSISLKVKKDGFQKKFKTSIMFLFVCRGLCLLTNSDLETRDRKTDRRKRQIRGQPFRFQDLKKTTTVQKLFMYSPRHL